MSDYRLKITIRNDRLLRAIEAKGFISVRKFCVAHGLEYQRTTEIINGKMKPLNEKGKLKNMVQQILDILEMQPEEAFTERQLQGFRKTSFVVAAQEEEMVRLVNPVKNVEHRVIENQVKLKITEMMHQRLNQREERILSLRYGLYGGAEHTLEELAQIFSITRERVRQIIIRAERKLKHTDSAKEIINSGVAEVYSSVNLTRDQIARAEDEEAFLDKLVAKNNKNLN